jgi:hypothetical protein
VKIWDIETKEAVGGYLYSKANTSYAPNGRPQKEMIRSWLAIYPECTFPTWENAEKLLR